MTISEISKVVHAKEALVRNNIVVDDLIIDTRWIHHSEHSLFIALVGKHRNGHAYIDDAYKSGIRSFLVLHHAEVTEYDDANYIYVSDTLQALQALGTYKREKFGKEVIGITGSNGKTIIKEWISAILAESDAYGGQQSICKNPKSYNSKIGVALSLWQLEERHTIGVFEGGISEPDEMYIIVGMIRPTLGILTNVGDAHLENFPSKDVLAREKVAMFHKTSRLVYRSDNPLIVNAIEGLRNINPSITLYNWSTQDAQAVFFVTYPIARHHDNIVHIRHQGTTYSFTIAFTQLAFIENAVHTIVTLMILGLDTVFIQEMLTTLRPVGMRLELREAANNSMLIADTYNSDVSSIKVALDYLAQQHGDKKMIIISDISAGVAIHRDIIDIINKSIRHDTIDKIITIGPIFRELNDDGYFQNFYAVDSYLDTDSYLRQFQLSQIHNHLILLKGARKFQFEKIQQRLELLIHNTVMEVNLENLQHNLNAYRNTIARGTKMMAMVKAFSYGHGGIEIADKLQYEGVDYLAVAYTDEGIELRNGGIKMPIMVMSPDISAFESMIRWRLEPEIFSLRSLNIFIEKTIHAQESHYPIHIKINTGMNRLGLDESDIEEVISVLATNDTVRVASIFSHLAASDEERYDDFTVQQKLRFELSAQRIIASLPYRPLIHLANTSGIFHKSALQYSMVRLGIGLYGIDTSQQQNVRLKPVATLKSYIVQIRKVTQGDTVGYSRKGVLHRDSVIATVAIGYADGYFRDFGNGAAYMMVKGIQAPIVGSICMDMTMIDITDIDGVVEGDEVIVFGESLPVTILAHIAKTIPYEILTGISQRVKRIFYNG